MTQPPPGDDVAGSDEPADEATEANRTQLWIFGILGLAIVVLLAIIAVALLTGDDDEVAADTTAASVATTAPATTAVTETTAAATTTAPATTTTTMEATTTEATTTTTVPPTTAAPGPCSFLDDLDEPIDDLRYLDTEGFGALTSFGDEPEPTIEILTCLLGEPTDDSGWVDSFSVFGTCPGTEVRGVIWGPLTFLFGDGADVFDPDGGRHFYNWSYNTAGPDPYELGFPDTGIGLGSTVAELEAEYGADLEVFDDPDFGSTFRVGESEDRFFLIFGTLTGVEPADVVTYLEAGQSCGE